MALRAIDGALNWAIDDVTGFLHIINQDGSDALGGAINFGITPGSGTVITTQDIDIDFSASGSEDFVIPVSSKVCQILGTRLYIRDPQSQTAISRNYNLKLYPNTTRLDGDLYTGFQGKGKFVYTQLAVATAIGNKELDVDDISNFSFDDPMALLGDIVNGLPVADIGTKFHTILDPNNTPPLTVDNIGLVYPINNGVVNIGSFKDTLHSPDGANIFGTLDLDVPDTFDVRLHIIAASI